MTGSQRSLADVSPPRPEYLKEKPLVGETKVAVRGGMSTAVSGVRSIVAAKASKTALASRRSCSRVKR